MKKVFALTLLFALMAPKDQRLNLFESGRNGCEQVAGFQPDGIIFSGSLLLGEDPLVILASLGYAPGPVFMIPLEILKFMDAGQWGKYLLGGSISLIAILFFVLQIRRNRRQIIQRLRNDMVQDLHDEIGASLSNICLLSALVERAIPAAPSEDESRQFLHRINEEATKIHDTISDSITVLDPSYEHLNELAALLMHHAQETFRYQEITFSVHLPESLRTIIINPIDRREFYLILKEGLHNIARHSEATEACIAFLFENGRLLCRISDNGKGFDTGRKTYGSGLKNMFRRAKMIGGRLSIQSCRNLGTSITLHLPVNMSFLRALRWKWAKRQALSRGQSASPVPLAPKAKGENPLQAAKNYAKEY